MVTPDDRGQLLQWLDGLVQRIRHHRWRFNPRKHFVDLSEVPVDRPVFLLGVQGGGLTLIGRVLRRHPTAISVTGDSEYWTGSDEMQNVMADVLPEDLRLRGHPTLEAAGLQDSWLYATDELLSVFRRTAADATEELADELLARIREILLLHGDAEPNLRLVDKSQSYTVKVSFLARLLDECSPRFLLVTRNPYALCQRATDQVLTSLDLSRAIRLRLAVEHWSNSMRCALEDGADREGFGAIRFEDFLSEPERTLEAIDEVVEMQLSPDLLPAPGDAMPLGTPPDGKWYPLRPDVNEKYLREISDRVVEAVDERCGDLAERLGYTPDGP